ncbi:MAG: hypothetical protein EOP19_13545, partial [Hyphomicrobiales bacterium]
LGLATRPFPNPLTAAAGSTVVDLESEHFYAETLADLPPLFQEVAAAYADALEVRGKRMAPSSATMPAAPSNACERKRPPSWPDS